MGQPREWPPKSDSGAGGGHRVEAGEQGIIQDAGGDGGGRDSLDGFGQVHDFGVAEDLGSGAAPELDG